MGVNWMILFVLVPLLELFLLIRIGRVLGAVNTVLIVILTGVLGAAFARTQGLGIIGRIRTALGRGELPGRELLEGVMILAGGIMLITPGFITDLAGFSLILPLSRHWIAVRLLRSMRIRMGAGAWTGGGGEDDADVVIEAEADGGDSRSDGDGGRSGPGALQ